MESKTQTEPCDYNLIGCQGTTPDKRGRPDSHVKKVLSQKIKTHAQGMGFMINIIVKLNVTSDCNHNHYKKIIM
jgi:hypothetical protein